MLCFNTNPVLHAKFTRFQIVCKPQTLDPRVALNLNFLDQTHKAEICAAVHVIMPG